MQLTSDGFNCIKFARLHASRNLGEHIDEKVEEEGGEKEVMPITKDLSIWSLWRRWWLDTYILMHLTITSALSPTTSTGESTAWRGLIKNKDMEGVNKE